MLTDTGVRNAQAQYKPFKLADSNSLHLLITIKGAKYWRYDYRFQGKRKTLAIGIYPQVSLREARSIRDAARDVLRDGRDPALKKQKPDQPSSSDTFEAVARELISKKASGWSEGHTDRTLRPFEVDIFPHLGAMPINSINAAMVLKVLQRMEKRGIADNVLRARENVGAVFRYGISAGRCSNAAPLFRAALV